MKTSRVSLITLLCVEFFSQNRIYGAEVEMRVRRGDFVFLYCDALGKLEFETVWFINSSHGNQAHFGIWMSNLTDGELPHVSFAWNYCNNTNDLLIRNITESDLGLYYCALHERKFGGEAKDLYHYGKRSTRLLFAEEAPTILTGSPERCVSWWALVSVGTVCVLLSSLFTSICVYCLCRNTTKADLKTNQESSHKRQTQRSAEAGGDVCYTSIDVQNLKTKKKKQKVQRSDLSTYSEVRLQVIQTI